MTFVVRADLMRSRIGDEPVSDNAITGVIKGMEYAGSVILLVLELASGDELKVEQHESLSQGLSAPRHGAELTVSWSAADGHLLPTP